MVASLHSSSSSSSRQPPGSTGLGLSWWPLQAGGGPRAPCRLQGVAKVVQLAPSSRPAAAAAVAVVVWEAAGSSTHLPVLQQCGWVVAGVTGFKWAAALPSHTRQADSPAARQSSSFSGARVARLAQPRSGVRAARVMPVVECKRVAVLGAAGGIGQPLSLLMKMNKCTKPGSSWLLWVWGWNMSGEWLSIPAAAAQPHPCSTGACLCRQQRLRTATGSCLAGQHPGGIPTLVCCIPACEPASVGVPTPVLAGVCCHVEPSQRVVMCAG
jgi:hypothetical protein